MKNHLYTINKIIVECQTILDDPSGKIESKYRSEHDNNKDPIAIGASCFEDLYKEICLINTTIANDYKNMGEVQSFFDDKL